MIKNLVFLFLILIVDTAQSTVADSLKYLPVQDQGRVKPFDSFAKESLQLIYGKQTYNKKEAVDIVLTWILIPQFWENQKIIQISSSSLRESLKFSKDEMYYSPKDLLVNERMTLLFQNLRSQIKTEKKISPFYQDVQRLQSQISLFHGISIGESIRLMPEKNSTFWLSLAQLQGEESKIFKEITQNTIKITELLAHKSENPEALKRLREALKLNVDEFIRLGKQNGGEKYADMNRIHSEVFLNSFSPFLISWIAYLLGALFLLVAYLRTSNSFYRTSWIILLIAFALHSFGFLLRVYIIQRPPVSNMYETVLWVPWGAMIFAFYMEWKTKNKVILLISAISSALCLILTDIAPTVLDSSLQPLQPVLRSTFWLTTHVLMITISYGAFLLAWGLGNFILILYLLGEKSRKKTIKETVKAIYDSMKIGVVLLAAGIILGGIWADYSWGRFWGWDPKETWALIALLGYIAILHARIVGWVKDFGMAVSAVISFSLVIMAWYGVNFILGAGLHAYGFGAGGVEYVAALSLIQILFVVFVAIMRQDFESST